MDGLLVSLDLCGTFVFALSGALAGVKGRLDLFGVMVLSFVAANTGGIIRDLLIGATPPPAISDWKYVTVSLVAGLLTFFYFPVVKRFKSPVQILDAGGLALFAVSGSLKAIEYELGPVAAMMLGMLTGIGGGMARDILIAQTPIVLRADFYASAALAGSLVVVVGKILNIPLGVPAVIGALLCFGIRLIAIRKGWRLPVAEYTPSSEKTSSLPK